MQLTFTKRTGKADDLVVTRADGTSEKIQCPKQGMIPHDMVHYAVEKILGHRGFLTNLAEGDTAGFTMTGDAAAEAVERLVETIQAEIWSGPAPTETLLEMYKIACSARDHAVLPVSAAEIDLIRLEMEGLAQQWDAVPFQGSMVLHLAPAAVRP